MAASKGMMDRAPGTGRRIARWWRGSVGQRRGSGARIAAGMVAGLAYYYLVPNPLLALPGLVAFAALAWLRLDLALFLLPLTFPFWYVPKRALGQAVFPLSEIALGVCLAVAVGHLLLAWFRVTKDAKDTNPVSTFFATFADLRILRVLRHPLWRWLVIGAALLLVGTAVGVLIAVRPRDALRAFRWEVAEPLLYAALLIACLWRRYAPSRPAARDAAGGDRERIGGQAIGWLAGPVLAVGALFGVLAIAQVLWLRVGFTPLAAGNRLVTLAPAAGESLLRATGIYYGSANSLGALLERVLPLALALLLWRALGGAETENAKTREEEKRLTTEGTEATEEAEGERASAEDIDARTIMPVPNAVGARHAAPARDERALPIPPASSASSAVPPSPSTLSSVPSVSSVVIPSFVPTLLLGACVLVMVAGLVLSASRGAVVGAAAGLLLVLLAHPRTRRITVVIVALGAVVAVWQAGALLQAALVGHGASGEVRLLLWQSALHMIRDHPLLGIGPDQFLYYYDPAYTAHPYWIPRIDGHLTPAVSQPNLAHPHNLALELWLSGGVLGLVGFALVLGWLAWSCWRIWRANRWLAAPDPRHWTARTALVVGVAGGVFAGLTHGVVDSAYFQPDLALLFWWAVAVVALPRLGLPAVPAARTAAPRVSSQGMPGAARGSERDTRDQTISGTGRS